MDFTLKTSIVLFLSLIVANQALTINLAKSINNLSLNFYKENAKTQNGNFFCSGYSLSTALSMLLVGARNNTATEIQNTLGYQGLSEKQVEDAYHDLLTKQQSNSKGSQLDVANSVWIKQGFNVLETFKNTLEKVYYAEEEEVAFGTKAATDQINNWVSNKTNGKIPKLFDDTLDASTRLVLVNAMYFKGIWKTPFSKELTAKESFYLGVDDNKKPVEMMSVYDEFPYQDNADFNAQLLELPYQGEDVSMIIILPKTLNGLSTLEEKLTEAKLENALKQMYLAQVHVKIPKFNASSTFNLQSVLQSLGIRDAFAPQADFSGIDGNHDLYISQGIQKAVVEVNEEGTVAAAATGFAGASAAGSISIPPPEIYFTANHPFLYVIRHNPTGVFLFIGRMKTP